MPIFSRLFIRLTLILAVFGHIPQAMAEAAVPESRFLYTKNTDFYGADLDKLFDTDVDACARACAAQDACVAFTFNTRSNACFPKSRVSETRVYSGALSAKRIPTAPDVLARSDTLHQKLAFLAPDDVSAAYDLVADIARRFPLEGTDAASDERWTTQQTIAATDDAQSWAQLARSGLRDNGHLAYQERMRLQQQAVPAALNAYLRAADKAGQGAALEILAQALEANGRGRDMIPVLRLAHSAFPRPDTSAALDDAIGKYGFRIIEHRVDNDAAAPRVCAAFSEKLIERGVDYTPFVRVEGSGFAVEPDGQQLCIDGVEHGKRYAVTLRAGLPAASGEVLSKDATLMLYVRDRTPLVRFPGRAYVLPRSADAAIPIESVNTGQVDLILRRVSDRNLVAAIKENYFGRPLNRYEEEHFADTLAHEVWRGKGQVQNRLNADMTTRLPLGDVLAGQPAGIYTISASIPGQIPDAHPAATQWFVLSDLGISTWMGTDGLHVVVRSLSDVSPSVGVTISLVSRANAILGTALVDADGFAQFPAGLTRGTGAASPALLMAQDGDLDLAFLPLTDPSFDLSDRGVDGRAPSPLVDTFLTTDRGAYRAGETIYVTTLTRDDQASAVLDLPVTAILNRPDGVEYSRTLSQNSVAGGHVFALPLDSSVPRGTWRLDIVTDPNMPALASQTVVVEDFLPERLELDLLLPATAVRLGETMSLSATARYLFGAPGARLKVEGDLRLRTTRSLEGWDGYVFGRYDTRFDTRSFTFDGTTTGAAGNAALSLDLPLLDEVPDQPLQAEISVRLLEGSGRPVERREIRAIRSQGPLIGIKSGFDATLPEGGVAQFDVVAVDQNGQAAEMPVRWTLNKVETRYQWYQLYGNWAWEPVTRRIRVDSGDMTLPDRPMPMSVPTDWGQYELVVEAADAKDVVTSVAFSSGWYGSDAGQDTPDRLVVSLDAQTYGQGDTAVLRVVPDADGIAMISVLSGRVISQSVVQVQRGENLISLPVTPEWGTGAYVSASVLHPMDLAQSLNPARALGLVHATVRPAQRQLDVSVTAPDSVDGQPGQMRTTVQVDGIAEGEAAYVTLAAIDVGILNLTRFDAPDVTGHYFGQRRLGVEIRDLYGRLIDGMNGALGAIRSGGDASANLQLGAPPPTEKLMAFFTGPVRVGANGRVDIDVQKPAFNGTVRLMAIAWTPSAIGDASKDVMARDPVVISASLPRFLAPGDKSRLLLEMVHAHGPTGEMALAIDADAALDLGAAPATVTVGGNGSSTLDLPLVALKTGDPVIKIALTMPDGKVLRKTLLMPVRDTTPETATTQRLSLGGGESFTFDANVFAGLRDGTASATLTAGPLARFDVPGLLRHLDRYPYGCTEQLTSGAMPLLYLGQIATAAGIGNTAEVEGKVQSAIAQILTRQTRDGGFGMWSSQGGDFWLDAYVTDFLSRARSAGHAVPDIAFATAMDNLRNRISYAADFERGGEDIAYALLVLAREGAASMGDLRYYADTKATDFATPLSLAQLGAALAAYGDPTRADSLFARAAALLETSTAKPGWRDDFGSALRDAAGVLTLAAEAGSNAVDRGALVLRLGNAPAELSTQEAAQVVLAAHALGSDTTQEGLRVNGNTVAGPLVLGLDDSDASPVIVHNTQDTAIDVTLTTFGHPLVAAAAGGYGYAIKRDYYTTEGASAAGPLQAGDRRVVVLTITPFEKIGARLMIDDPLPAGFEIDNPNLIRSGDIAALAWLETSEVESVEFRSDRFLAAVNHRGEAPFRLAYIVRAVTPGTYRHPAASVVDMYRPEYRAQTATGQVGIKR